MVNQFTIGQLAREANVPTSTVRYYERRGLLKPAGRSAGNYRVYDDAAVNRLLFVRSAQAAGFTLSDIGSLLSFEEGESAPCREVQDLITARLKEVAKQTEHLKVVDRTLRSWMKVCQECIEAEKTGRCGVLDGLRSPKKKKKKKKKKKSKIGKSS